MSEQEQLQELQQKFDALLEDYNNLHQDVKVLDAKTVNALNTINSEQIVDDTAGLYDLINNQYVFMQFAFAFVIACLLVLIFLKSFKR